MSLFVGFVVLEVRDRILNMLRDERENLAALVAGGASGSYDDYKSQTGRIAGLDRALAVVVEGFRHLTEDDDDGNDLFPL